MLYEVITTSIYVTLKGLSRLGLDYSHICFDLKEEVGGEFKPGENVTRAAEAISREIKDQQRRQLFHMVV